MPPRLSTAILDMQLAQSPAHQLWGMTWRSPLAIKGGAWVSFTFWMHWLFWLVILS
jgi:hypothetical protein